MVLSSLVLSVHKKLWTDQLPKEIPHTAFRMDTVGPLFNHVQMDSNGLKDAGCFQTKYFVGAMLINGQIENTND